MSAGRKRAFDKEEALDIAMRVFWENGYAGTSLSDLTKELGINKPSLYAAFGNKEQLFTAALDRYRDHYGAPIMQRLTNPPDTPLKKRLQAYLYDIINMVTDCESPKGCMFVKSCCESGSEAIPSNITTTLRNKGTADETGLSKLLEHERQCGQLPENAQVQAIAGYLLSVMYGLSILARQGKTTNELKAVADMAVRSLPE